MYFNTNSMGWTVFINFFLPSHNIFLIRYFTLTIDSQCEGKDYNDKYDIWSLGCILYEMVCLQKAFDGTNISVLVHKIVESDFAPVKGDYSQELKQLVHYYYYIIRYLTRSGKSQQFAHSIKIMILQYLASIISELQV